MASSPARSRRRRRRNADGSLVTPLSAKQLANLEKGRRALAAKIAGDTKAPASAAAAAGKGERGGRRVETVTLAPPSGAKAKRRSSSSSNRRTAKASGSSAKTTGSNATVDAEGKAGGGRGLGDRLADWLSST
jgi:hypothetical protein